MTNTTDQLNARLRRADDGVLTEMARSLLKDSRGGAATSGRRLAAQVECAQRAGARFKRASAAARLTPRVGGHPIAARRA